MNCTNCGAPMLLDRERDYFHCEYCRAFYFPKSSSDGIRLLGDNPEGIRCPVCMVPLQLSTFDERYQSNQCPKCRGVLFRRPVFGQAVEARRARAVGPGEPSRGFNPEELRRRLACPVCSHEMSTHQYFGPGRVVVDTCDGCDLIWLDYSEFEKVVSAPGSDRGTSTLAPPRVNPIPATYRGLPEEKQAASHGGLWDLLEALFGE